jgi:hypothetical protein
LGVCRDTVGEKVEEEVKKKVKENEREREMAWQVFNLLRGFYLQLGINKSVLSGGNLPSR